MLIFEIKAEVEGKRIDQYLSSFAALKFSRSQIKRMVKNGQITVNGSNIEPSYKLKFNDAIRLVPPPLKELSAAAESIPLDIIYEDDDIIVVNKKRGMVTHPAPGNYSGTLVNALLAHCDHLANLGAPLRPGIVHRLDKDTSGIIVAAKTDAAYLSLAKQMKARTVEKTYAALVNGVIKKDGGMISARIGRHPINRKKMTTFTADDSKKSREAISYYKVLRRFKKYTLVEVKIKTGRTHQIRVHMSFVGHPLAGDPTYGVKRGEIKAEGQLLHAQKLAFIHPRTGKLLEFETPLPPEMEEIISLLSRPSPAS